MPFTNRSGVVEDDVFADGMVEDVIDALSLGGGMKVLSSSATRGYRKGVADLGAAARQLGVRYMLEGNVRRVGATLRVTCQLVEGETSNVVWIQRFDRPLAELAELQEDLVSEVAAHLGVQVRQLEVARALKKPSDLTAWEALVRGSSGSLSLRSIRTAIEHGRKALSIEPDYAAAHASMASSLGALVFWTGGDMASVPETELHIDRALALAPDEPNVLARVAWALCMINREQEALPLAERAAALNHNLAAVQGTLGLAYIRLRRWDEGIAHFEAERRLSPGSAGFFHSVFLQALAQLLDGRLEAAEATLDRSLSMNPNFAGSLLLKTVIFQATNREEGASDVIRRIRRTEPGASLDMHVNRLSAYLSHPFGPNPPFDERLAAFRALWESTPLENWSVQTAPKAASPS
ncbi:MAG TPA: hypothetical protein VN814_22975 [Caulobacteraceae bacterium]|nr:hypothetical protein [Caulobacteraceae bacterium]